ncbi:hypothetical protein AWH48_12040 [Domibacillus aminovorans]|uniref:Phage neck terminator protein gp12-like domain-containing protein n=1 Tax=Domibacillus aminovorans TaxID=29332 RepID=A0A177KI55_9BACI|nr:hypothetical protein [Domibacillus aminovorans]OAH53082.1 hypothetical protein AWH48_12040 [Domibacillus aminovorans]
MKVDNLKAMIEVLTAHTGVLIVKADQQGAEQPPLPYGQYKVTSPHIKGRGRGHITQYTEAETEYERLTTQPLMVISFSFFHTDEDSSRELAVLAHGWFQFAGALYFVDEGTAIAHIGNVENRTTHIVDHYDYRHGFDVQILSEHHIDRVMEWIEKANITQGGN